MRREYSGKPGCVKEQLERLVAGPYLAPMRIHRAARDNLAYGLVSMR
jgi:hypothetical protein